MSAQRISLIAIYVALLTVSAWISVPMTVPFTLQTFSVFLISFLSDSVTGGAAILIYIGLGALGVPVFSGFGGGIGILLGATGGYIFGFFLTFVAIRFFVYAFKGNSVMTAVGGIVGLLLCYVSGTLWFTYVYSATKEISALTALSLCVLPFVLPDMTKLFLAIFIWGRLSKIPLIRNFLVQASKKRAKKTAPDITSADEALTSDDIKTL